MRHGSPVKIFTAQHECCAKCLLGRAAWRADVAPTAALGVVGVEPKGDAAAFASIVCRMPVISSPCAIMEIQLRAKSLA